MDIIKEKYNSNLIFNLLNKIGAKYSDIDNCIRNMVINNIDYKQVFCKMEPLGCGVYQKIKNRLFNSVDGFNYKHISLIFTIDEVDYHIIDSTVFEISDAGNDQLDELKIHLNEIILLCNELLTFELSKYYCFLVTLYMADIRQTKSDCFSIQIMLPLFNHGRVLYCDNNDGLNCTLEHICNANNNIGYYNNVFTYIPKDKDICCSCLQKYGIEKIKKSFSELMEYEFSTKYLKTSLYRYFINMTLKYHNKIEPTVMNLEKCLNASLYNTSHCTIPETIILILLMRKYIKNTFAKIPQWVFNTIIMEYVLFFV